MANPAMTAKDVLAALRRRHARQAMQRHQWAFIPELRVGPNRTSVERRVAQHQARAGAETDWSPSDLNEARIDAFALHVEKQWTRAFEIKVSRSDFLHEITNPDKRAPALALSNEYFFAAPKGMIDPDEIPDECGLLEVVDYGGGPSRFGAVTKTFIKREAPWRDVGDLPWSFIASIALRAS